jgi:hypothetical protein
MTARQDIPSLGFVVVEKIVIVFSNAGVPHMNNTTPSRGVPSAVWKVRSADSDASTAVGNRCEWAEIAAVFSCVLVRQDTGGQAGSGLGLALGLFSLYTAFPIGGHTTFLVEALYQLCAVFVIFIVARNRRLRQYAAFSTAKKFRYVKIEMSEASTLVGIGVFDIVWIANKTFVQIRPSRDHNGPVGRILSDNLLIQREKASANPAHASATERYNAAMVLVHVALLLEHIKR